MLGDVSPRTLCIFMNVACVESRVVRESDRDACCVASCAPSYG